MSWGQRNRIYAEYFIRQGFASDSHNGRIFRFFFADMVSNACRIGSSVEFRLHDLSDLCESIAHLFEFIGQIDYVLFETIDFSLERLNWINRNMAVICSLAPTIVAAPAITRALCGSVACVPATWALGLVNSAITWPLLCLRNGADGSNGNSKFHVCVVSLFLIC